MELENRKYLVSFIPVASGDHVVSIHINGIHISRSPTRISCSSTITDKMVEYKKAEYTGITYADSVAVEQAEHNVRYKEQTMPKCTESVGVKESKHAFKQSNKTMAKYKETIVVEKAKKERSYLAESSMPECKHHDNPVHNDKIPYWQSYDDPFLF